MSELRQDPVSGDWIIVAPDRIKRPHELFKKRTPRRPSSIRTCPFEDARIRKSSQWPPMVSSPSEENWRVIITQNKYPALTHIAGCASLGRLGPHNSMTGTGEHDLVITRDHKKNFADLSPAGALEVLKIIQERYKMLARDRCNLYASTFFNWGVAAGASVYHPHYQILTLPIVPPDVSHSLNGSRRYFQKHKRCVHCVLLAFDLKEKKRIVDEDALAVSVAPRVSRVPFEMRVFPKKHLPYFERTSDRDLKDVAAVLQKTLRRIKRYLKDPDLNFFIHTAPFESRYDYYHWHIEITPKISIWGGFELGTGIDINVVDPATAAAMLKGK
ncbi:MAG: DUF4921 family protein [Candidatus Liptonbacteria bacterium]|nr:DUF4921 family protein [Candidatus Liptonbacteria bacterium]